MSESEIFYERQFSIKVGQVFDELVSHVTEESHLGFKESFPALDSPDAKGEFLKDLLSLYNGICQSWHPSISHPHKEAAYLVIGVRNCAGKPNELVHVDNAPDPALFETLIRANTMPQLSVYYRVVEREDVVHALLEIIRDDMGPAICTKTIGTLKKDDIWFRNGTSKQIATTAQDVMQVQKEFKKQFDGMDWQH